MIMTLKFDGFFIIRSRIGLNCQNKFAKKPSNSCQSCLVLHHSAQTEASQGATTWKGGRHLSTCDSSSRCIKPERRFDDRIAVRILRHSRKGGRCALSGRPVQQPQRHPRHGPACPPLPQWIFFSLFCLVWTRSDILRLL